MRRFAACILLASSWLSGCAATETQSDPAAEAVIARTKAPGRDYSLFLWTVVRAEGEQLSSWAAEFHRGSLHRVETPFGNIIADCEKMTGHHHSLMPDIQLSSREAAETACGIDMPSASAVTYLGAIPSDYGDLDIVALTKGGLRRSYWVNPAGILVQAQFVDPGTDGMWVLRNWATRVDYGSPDPAMFAVETLATNFIPAEFQVERPPDYVIGFDTKAAARGAANRGER